MLPEGYYNMDFCELDQSPIQNASDEEEYNQEEEEDDLDPVHLQNIQDDC